MGLEGRIGIVFTNIAVLIPVFVLLLTSAIMSSVGAAKLAKLTGTTNAHKWVSMSTVALWVLFGGGLLFSFTVGLFIIPYVVTIPYLFGGALSLFGILNLAIAAVLFYGANVARTNPAYSNTADPTGQENAKSAYTSLLICGIMMTIAAVFMFGYSAFTIYKYHKGGGLTGDVALVGQYGGDIAMAAGQPELAVPLQAVGGMAKKRLSTGEQEELAQRGAQVGKLQSLGGQFQQAAGKGGGISDLIKNPEALQSLMGAFA